jgi:Thioredoxin domain-containing protein
MDMTGMLTIAFVAAVLGWILYLRYAANAAVGRSVELLREQIPQLEGTGPMLVYCYRPNCGPCRSMTPVMEALAHETGQVFKFDVSRDLETAQKIGIRATPTILVVAAGEVREVLIGAQSPGRLKRLLESPA